jgi:1,4-alpha-glucan branching enzyme
MGRLTRISLLAAALVTLGVSSAPASVRVDDEEVVFRLAGVSAEKVLLVGDFNGWNPTIDRLVESGGGFEIRFFLLPGRYRYRFIVDGVSKPDPDNPFIDRDGNSCFILAERKGGALEIGRAHV